MHNRPRRNSSDSGGCPLLQEQEEAAVQHMARLQRRGRTEATTNILAAARLGTVNTIEELLKLGQPVDTKDESDWTPLHFACKRGNADMVQCLLENKAPTNARTRSNSSTPLHETTSPTVAKLLLEERASINARDYWGQTALHRCCKEKRIEVALVLLLYGADVSLKDRKGRTALHISSWLGCKPLIHELRMYGARCDVADSEGRTAMDYAKMMAHEEACSALQDGLAEERTQALAYAAAQNPMQWRQGELIGQGGFGRVYKGVEVDTGRLIAAKEIGLEGESARILKTLQAIESEMSIVRRLSHPNIVDYLGIQIESDRIFLLMEYAPGGSVGTRIRLHGALRESEACDYISQALLGLVHLHARGVIHRDLKCDNLLIGDQGQILLADFGASKQLRYLQTLRDENLTTIGSPYWMAPEVIQNGGYGRKADVWSLGCSLIEMLTGRPPWSHFDNPLTAIWHIGMGKSEPLLPKEASEMCLAFISLCMERDTALRQSSSQLLRHPWLQNGPCECIRSLSPFEDTSSPAGTPEPDRSMNGTPEFRSLTSSPEPRRNSVSSGLCTDSDDSASDKGGLIESLSEDTNPSTLFGTLSLSTSASFVSKTAVLLPPPT